MNRMLAKGILLFASTMTLHGFEPVSVHSALAQGKAATGFSTLPKTVSAQLKLADGTSFSVPGRATFTVVQANENDTVTGTLVFDLSVEARKRIAQSSHLSLNSVPANVSVQDLTASFQRGSACPQIKLLLEAKTVEIANAQLLFDRIVLQINETAEQMNQLFCSWTRQINVKRQRQGIIAAINRLLAPLEPTEEAVENKPVKP